MFLPEATPLGGVFTILFYTNDPITHTRLFNEKSDKMLKFEKAQYPAGY